MKRTQSLGRSVSTEVAFWLTGFLFLLSFTGCGDQTETTNQQQNQNSDIATLFNRVYGDGGLLDAEPLWDDVFGKVDPRKEKWLKKRKELNDLVNKNYSGLMRYAVNNMVGTSKTSKRCCRVVYEELNSNAYNENSQAFEKNAESIFRDGTSEQKINVVSAIGRLRATELKSLVRKYWLRTRDRHIRDYFQDALDDLNG